MGRGSGRRGEGGGACGGGGGGGGGEGREGGVSIHTRCSWV